MSEQFWLSDEQVESLAPYLPGSRGKARVDDRRVLSGIIHVQRNDLRWCDAPAIYGPRRTLYNRHVRWTRNSMFARIFVALAEAAGLLTNALPPARALIADRGYDSNGFRAALEDLGITPWIPSRKNRKHPHPHDPVLYRQRHPIENLFANPKDWKHIATRYDRCADIFMGANTLAATVTFWLNK